MNHQLVYMFQSRISVFFGGYLEILEFKWLPITHRNLTTFSRFCRWIQFSECKLVWLIYLYTHLYLFIIKCSRFFVCCLSLLILHLVPKLNGPLQKWFRLLLPNASQCSRILLCDHKWKPYAKSGGRTYPEEKHQQQRGEFLSLELGSFHHGPALAGTLCLWVLLNLDVILPSKWHSCFVYYSQRNSPFFPK